MALATPGYWWTIMVNQLYINNDDIFEDTEEVVANNELNNS